MRYPKIVIQNGPTNTLTIDKKRMLSSIECEDVTPTLYREEPMSGSAFLLNNMYDYALVEDEKGNSCLVPLRKE